MTGTKIYGRDSFKKIPLDVQRILQSLKAYGFGHGSEKFRQASDHRQIVRLMKQTPCSPFTIIIEEELLDPSHYWDKRYVKITAEQIVSELDETVLRYVDTLEKLCLAPSDMGSNYQVNPEEMQQLLRDTLRVERGGILEPIRAIEVRPFFENGSKVSSAS
ncbi:MAG: hypothetical protein MUP27_14925 [Desulfobacterales bacterium]|nr:hypothetical protein [Desulfobacterales bacterium]